MSRQPIPPPPGDRPVPTAPPPPPRWRFSLWPIALITVVLLYIFLPGIKISTPVSLSYSQFIADAGAHKIKTVDFGNGASGSNTTATGDLTDGKAYTTVIPGPPTTALSQQLSADGVKSVTAQPPSSGLGTDLLYWLFLLLPFIIVWWVFRRMSRASGGAAGLQGVLGVGRSRAKVFDAERPETKFSDVAGYEGVKSEIGEVIDFLRNPGRYQRAGAVAPRGMLMSARRARAKRCSRGPWPARPQCRSSRSPAQASWRCSSASARPGSATCSARRASGPPRSSSSTRSTPSVSGGRARAQR
jgi:cell division protease FtsH